MNGVLRDLRRTTLLREASSLSDGDLLKWFLTQREEAAFEILVRRHGPMVLGVCRRILRHSHGAEDAFQATFLVLMRKAGSITRPEVLGAWLYGVAYRIAVRAKAMTARRRTRERQAGQRAEPSRTAEELWPDLEPVLDREVNRLPSKYRIPLVLCELEGQSRKDAARHLGLPEGTLSSRLARARELLRRRMTAQGLALSSGVLASALSTQAATAAVPAPLLAATARAAGAFGAGPGAVAGLLPVRVIALADGALRALLLSKLQIGVAVLLGVGLLGAGVGLGVWTCQGPEERPTARTAAVCEVEPATPAGDEQVRLEPAPLDEALAAADAEGPPDEIGTEDPLDDITAEEVEQPVTPTPELRRDSPSGKDPGTDSTRRGKRRCPSPGQPR
jgi:RNA polymerase sigma factor (sigma-70 family)